MLRFHHLNIVVADMERSLAYYRDLLGMRQTFETDLQGEWIDTVVGIPGARARCVFVQPDHGGMRLELLQYLDPAGAPVAGASAPNALGLRHFALEVDDLEGVVARLRDSGHHVFSDPVRVPFTLVGGIRKTLAYTLDPDGVIVEFCQHDLEPATANV
ncbi:MAG: VOC family protein [Armatimonadota bacterium]